MKRNGLFSLCIMLAAVNLYGGHFSFMKPGSKDSSGHHKLNFCFTWFELGAGIPFKEKKLKNLPYGMNQYLYGAKGDFGGAGFGVGLYYKNHWGITAIFNFLDFKVPDAAFKNYISSQYPGYFLPNWVQAQSYSMNNVKYRLSYRFHKRHFTYEPQLQIGINDYRDFDTKFVLKEDGSNQFIEYSINKENRRKNSFSYSAAIVARWRYTKPGWKWNIEPGVRMEVLVVPTNFRYTITSAPYNLPATVYQVDVKQIHPAITITGVLSFFRK